MADDNVKSEPVGTPDSGGQKPSLPPIRSSRPVGGGTVARTPAPSSSKSISASAPQVPKPVSRPPAPHPATVAPEQTPPSVSQSPTPARVIEPRKAKQDKPPEDDRGIWRMNRKSFVNVAGWLAFFSFLGTATVGALRLMVPRVLYEPPSAFKAGYPEDFIIGEVSEKYKDEFRVWIIREPEGFYALYAVCTHLGCTPRWAASEEKFKCPCHGSGYHKDGINFEGPTPRPLERLKITLADDGQILVDRNIKFLYEKQEWSRPDAYLKYG